MASEDYFTDDFMISICERANSLTTDKQTDDFRGFLVNLQKVSKVSKGESF